MAFNDGELPVKILADSNNNQPFKMRENKRTGLFQSLEARFDDHIISIAYEKNHLFPGEKMEIDIYMYVVEYATIDTAIFIKLDSGSVAMIQWYQIELSAYEMLHAMRTVRIHVVY